MTSSNLDFCGYAKLAYILWTKKIVEMCTYTTAPSLYLDTVYIGIYRGLERKSWLLAKVLDASFRMPGVGPREGYKTQLWWAVTVKDQTGGVW